jgi:hypothetical protein
VDRQRESEASMSLSAIKTYFRSRCDALGRTEHKDPFNVPGIGSTNIAKAYHLQLGSSTQTALNQSVLEISFPITVRLFFQGFRYPADGVDSAITESETLIKSSLKASNRLTGTIKNVRFDSMEVGPFDETNDNTLISTLNFTASVMIDVDT